MAVQELCAEKETGQQTSISSSAWQQMAILGKAILSWSDHFSTQNQTLDFLGFRLFTKMDYTLN